MATAYAFRKALISQMPAQQLLMALGYEYLAPREALALRGNSEREAVSCGGRRPRRGDA